MDFIELTINYNKTAIRKSAVIAFQEDSEKGGTTIWISGDQFIVNEDYEDVLDRLTDKEIQNDKKDEIIGLENKIADIEMKKVTHLLRAMDVGFLLGSGKTYEDWLEMNTKNKKESE